MATGSKIIKIDMIIDIDQYFFSFEPGLVSTSGPGPGQRCNGYLKVHKRNGFEEQNIEYKVLLIMIKGVQQKSRHLPLMGRSCLPLRFYKCFLDNPGLPKDVLHFSLGSRLNS